MKTVILSCTTAFLIAAGSVAQAQNPAPAASAPTPQTGSPERHMGRSITRAEVIAKVKTRFEEADTNKDGYVTREEWNAAIARQKSQWQAERFDRLDTNKDGKISREEFASGSGGFGGPGGPRGHGMKSAGGGHGMGDRMFDMADAKKDGRVSLQEATDAALRRFDMMDTNHDGTITPDERRQMRDKFRSMHGSQAPKAG